MLSLEIDQHGGVQFVYIYHDGVLVNIVCIMLVYPINKSQYYIQMHPLKEQIYPVYPITNH